MGTILFYSIRLMTRMPWLLGRGQLPLCPLCLVQMSPAPVSPRMQGVGQGVGEGGHAKPQGI